MTQRTFRILLIAGWIGTIFLVIAHFATLKYFPVELRNSYDVYIHAPQNSIKPIRLILDLLYLGFSFIISVGLFFFKKWARSLFLPSIVLGLLLAAVGRIVVDVAWVNSLKSVLSIISGIMLAAAYYSRLSSVFESKANV